MARKRDVKIAIVGLGNVGTIFLKKLLEKKWNGVKVVCVAEKAQNTSGIKLAQEHGIKIYANPEELAFCNEEVDVIFDLTGTSDATKGLQDIIAKSKNSSIVIAPETVAFLVWNLIAHGEEFPEHKAKQNIAAALEIIKKLESKTYPREE